MCISEISLYSVICTITMLCLAVIVVVRFLERRKS